jgi:hypothetical protein
MNPPPPRTDYGLWLAFSGGLSLAVCAAVLAVSGTAVFGHFATEALSVLAGFLVAAVVGWFLQEIARACGLRLSGRSKPGEAADYDDEPPVP